MAKANVAAMRAALEAGDMKALMEACDGAPGTEDIWGEAMNAFFGPGDIHPNRCDAQGRPLPETIVAFPHIGARMEEARARLPWLVKRYDMYC